MTTTAGPRTVLWVSAHPEPGSLNGHLTRAGTDHLERGGQRVLGSGMYAMNWTPVLDRSTIRQPPVSCPRW